MYSSGINTIHRLIATVAFAILLQLCTNHFAKAASDTSRLLQFNIENGFPSNNVYSVIQDRHGYLWFATDNGVVKYNGYKMKVFTTDDGLPSNDVWQLFEDSYGRVWLLSHSYRFGYIKDDQYLNVDYKAADRIIKPEYLTQIGDKLYYIFFKAASNRSLAMVDSNGHVSIIDSLSDCFTSLISFDSVYYTIQRNGLLKSYYLNGANKILGGKRKLEFILKQGGTSHQAFNNNIYVFSFKDKRILSIDIAKENFCYRYLTEFGARDDERIYTSFFDSSRLHLISNESIYVLRPDLSLKQKIDFRKTIPQTTQLSYFFRQRRSHITWYCTNSSGAWLKFGDNGLFQWATFYEHLNSAHNIKNSSGSNNYWLSSDKKKLYSLGSNGRLTFIGLFDDELRAVSKLGDSQLLLAFANGIYKAKSDFTILSKIPGNSEKIYTQHGVDGRTKVNDLSDELNLNNLSLIHQYKPGKLFTASSIFVSTLTFSNGNILHKLLIGDRINSLFYDSSLNRYFFYNKENISILDPETERSIRINTNQLANIGITNISSFQTDGNGNYFIHAGDKLYIYNYKKVKLTTRSTPVNLSKARISIYKKTLYVAGNFGFAYAEILKDAELSTFTVYPNPKKTFYNHVNAFLVYDGLVQISTDKGFYCFHLDSLKQAGINVRNSENDYINFIVKARGFKKVNEGDTLLLDQQHHTIDLDAVNYYGEGDIQYEYKIPQRSKEWYSTTSGEIVVSDLEPGVYHSLYLKAKDDSWKSKTYRLYVYAAPYWYQTTKWKNIFWIAAIVFSISLIALVIFLTRYFVARSSEKKQSLVDMELRALYSQINPHFIFNTLSTALFFISKRRYDEAYNHVSRFSKLLRTYLTSSRRRYIILAEEIEMIRNYIELQQIRFEEKFSYTIEVDNNVPANSIQIPTLLLQPLVENAINHGLFHRSSGGFLGIRFMQGKDNKELICIIEDNGVGRQRSKEIKEESVIQHESYGTQLTKELIEIFRKYENMNIYLEYTDKTGDDTGTIVKLTIRNLKYVA